MSDAERAKMAAMLLGSIVEMSDHAKAMGGTTSISGVAALHRMQTSIQKNRARIIDMLKLEVAEEQSQ